MNDVYEITEGEFLISTDFNKIQLDVIHHYLSQESYWAQNIPFEVVEKSAKNSLCFGVYHQNKQIGFARVTTDKSTFAYLADVFIIKEYRGNGLSKWLIKTIHSHHDLQGLRRWMLGTKDAHGLYRQFGWTEIPDDLMPRFMQIFNPDVYKKL